MSSSERLEALIEAIARDLAAYPDMSIDAVIQRHDSNGAFRVELLRYFNYWTY
jgi:hypothetical protein